MQFVKDFNNRCKVLECVSTLDFLFNSEMIISMFFSMYNDFRYMKFHTSKIIIHHLDGLFGPNILTSSQLACKLGPIFNY